MRETNRRELESLPALRQKAEGIDEIDPYNKNKVGLMNQAPTI